jgi:hypothetical protein
MLVAIQYYTVNFRQHKINKIMTNNDTGIYRTGDLVIGSGDPGKSVYSPSGAKLISDGVAIYGNERDLKAQSEELTRAAMRNGGIPLDASAQYAKSKKTSKKRTQYSDTKNITIGQSMFQLDDEQKTSVPPVEEKLQMIQFENDFGKMKAKVVHVIEQELAFMLIFKDEESMVFEPKVGESLTLHTPNKRRVDVYYPGVTFDSPDDSKKFMILFKLPEEEQE